MSGRRTDKINDDGHVGERPSTPAGSSESASRQKAGVSLNYPKPTMLSAIIEDVAQWSDYNFVMEPALNKPIQIFAPRPLSKSDAFSLFVASIETVGMRAVVVDGRVVKIVANGLGKLAI